MRFDVERLLEDFALADMTSVDFVDWVETTSHHPVQAANIAVELIEDGTDIIDACVKLYQDDWYGFDSFRMRFCHFYQLVHHLVG